MAVAQFHTATKRTRTVVAVVVGLGLLATVLFLVLGRVFGLDKRPGFFGTLAPFYSDINLVVEILMVIGLTIGLFLIRNRQRSAHQYMQTAMVLFNLVMMFFFMGIVFVQLLKPGTTISLSVIAEIFHGTIGIIAILIGLYLFLLMNNLLPKGWQIKGWKNLMRVAFGLYCVVALGGLVLYYLFFMVH